MNIIREPVVLINLIKAVIAVLITVGVPITLQQEEAFVQLAVTVLALLATIGVGAFAERARVTPIADPKLPENTVVKVYDEATGETVRETGV